MLGNHTGKTAAAVPMAQPLLPFYDIIRFKKGALHFSYNYLKDGGRNMTLYRATKQEFLEDIENGKDVTGFVSLMKDFYLSENGKEAGGKEIKSWYTSLPAMAKVLKLSHIPADTQVFIEYEIPRAVSKRHIDFMLAGKDNEGDDVVVVVELKAWQWRYAGWKKPAGEETTAATTFTHPTTPAPYLPPPDLDQPLHKRQVPAEHLHHQILKYKEKMETRLDAVSASTGRGYILVSCVYLYKYSPWTSEDKDDALVQLKNSAPMQDVEFFFKEDQKKFAGMLNDLFTRDSENDTIIDCLEEEQKHWSVLPF